MNVSVRFFLDTRKQTKDGTYQLSIVLQQKNKTATLSTGIRLREGEFDNKTQSFTTKCRDRKNLIEYINLKKSDILISLNNLNISGWSQGKTIKEIRDKIIDADTSDNINFGDVFKQYVQTKEKHNTLALYRNMHNNLVKFRPKVDNMPLIEFNIEFIKEFDKYLSQKANETTRRIYHSYLKAVFNYAISEDILQKNPYLKFKMPQKIISHRVAGIEELRKLRDTKLRNEAIDMFMLSFYLAGINMHDLLTVQKAENGILRYNRSKTGIYTEMVISDEALEIIRKYEGQNHLLSIGEELGMKAELINKRICKYSYCLHKARDNSGEIINSKLTPYYARHTWATIAHDLDIPDAIIDMALAHKSPYAMTEHYIIRNMKKVSEAAQKVIDYLNDDLKE